LEVRRAGEAVVAAALAIEVDGALEEVVVVVAGEVRSHGFPTIYSSSLWAR